MFDNVTPQQPHMLLLCRRFNAKTVATFLYNSSGVISGISMNNIGPIDRALPFTPSAAYETTERDLRNNVRSGLFEITYQCDEAGNRLEPLTGEAWQRVCESLREARVDLNRKAAAVEAARTALQQAEAAHSAATATAQQATRAFENAL